MDGIQPDMMGSSDGRDLSRRTAIRGLVIGGAAASLFTRWHEVSEAQEATPAAGECVATAPPLEDGIGFAQLLVGGIVPDMPAGPVEVRISRLAMAPGTIIEAEAVPYPSLMYMETGTTACPGGPGSHRLRPGRHHHRGDDRGGHPVHPGGRDPVHPGQRP